MCETVYVLLAKVCTPSVQARYEESADKITVLIFRDIHVCLSLVSVHALREFISGRFMVPFFNHIRQAIKDTVT